MRWGVTSKPLLEAERSRFRLDHRHAGIWAEGEEMRGYWTHRYTCGHAFDRRPKPGEMPRTREIVWTRPCGYCRNKAREAVR